ncbi:Uncharacterised protein [Candidatus Bilamarchaeum dharawalense]|uniref:Uncharacterized protein n=1 Tax=Candidatus Bilamarchaeum dharawalense TaxID=2885759 RepID=A0A5E4LRK7_9ARCH|nr:Uncharacterised protein [Candidatus Bilamarchaeum dharawalense]
MVKFEGKIQMAPFSGKECVYFETAIFYDNGTTSTGHYHTEEKFTAEINGQKTEIKLPPARMYLVPTFEKEFETKNAPEKFKEIFNNIFGNEMPEKVVVKEWALLTDREYVVNVVHESFCLPPLPGEKDPTEAKYTGYEIMDKEYGYEEKQQKRTPASYWTGG